MNVKNNRRKVRKYTYCAFQCIIVVCADELSKFLLKPRENISTPGGTNSSVGGTNRSTNGIKRKYPQY